MTDKDEVLAAFVKRFPEPTDPAMRFSEWHSKHRKWERLLEGYRAGHADCATQEAKDREDAERYRKCRNPQNWSYNMTKAETAEQFDAACDSKEPDQSD